MFKFLLQSDENTGYQSDVYTIEQTIKRYAWDNRVSVKDIMFKCSLQELDEYYVYDYRDAVPVGTVEFVETFMKIYHETLHIKPILIPAELNKFTYRMVTVVPNDTKVINPLFEKCPDLFIKSADVCKWDLTDIYNQYSFSALQYSFSANKLFVSEKVDIESEWRIFVFNGKIQKIANYSGDEWIIPNKETVKDMIATYKNCPPAYTLYVAVLKNGETAIIEVHNFISCGLYGFESSRIPIMLGRAWKYELNRKDNVK